MEKHVFRFATFYFIFLYLICFRIYDANNDGYVEEVLTKLFRLFDVNSDGVISKKEMARLVKDMYGLLKRDDPTVAAKDMIAKSAFAEMDKDEDGQVTTTEFLAACQAEAAFSKLLANKAIDIFMEEETVPTGTSEE